MAGVDTGGTSGAASAAGGMAGASGASGSTGAAGGAVGGGAGTAGGGGTSGAPGAGCGKSPGLTSGRASIDVNGTMREYILRVPDDYEPNRPYRLIFGWHQLAGSAESIANRGYYGLEEPSAGQAILVAPDGLVGNDNGDRGWWNNDGEDVDFYRAMLDRFDSELCIDRNRIFSTGFSFGAMFSFTLACTPDSMTRAIAPQAGSAFGGCGNATQPVAVLAFVGVNDSLLSGHRQAVNTFVERNGCSGEPIEMPMSWCDGLDTNNLPCVCVNYQNCDQTYPVISCEYEAGHTFAPNSGDTIWEFFSQF
jgi:poly(3-hydroxybutyrate) depolymerase